MISIKDERTYEFRGLSTDKKPINDYISNGSIFIEMDTSLIYTYDSTNKNWLILDWNQGGGGGSPIEAGTGIEITGTDTKTISIDEEVVATKEDLPDEVSGTNDGTNWTSLTIGEDTYGFASSGSSVLIFDGFSKEWIAKEGSGIANPRGRYLGTDGENICYSYNSDQYILDETTSTGHTKEWAGLDVIQGENIGTDGENIYYSTTTQQYVLDKTNSTWVPKIGYGLNVPAFYAWNIGTDGENIYYSDINTQLVLDINTSTGYTKEGNNVPTNGNHIGTDGENIYYSDNDKQWVLDKTNSKWNNKTGNGLSNLNGTNIWTDGENIYYSATYQQYVLDTNTSTGSPITGTDHTKITASGIGKTKNNIYYSSTTGSAQYILGKSTHQATILEKVAETGDYNDLKNKPSSNIDITEQEMENYFNEYCNINASVTEESIGEEETINVLNLDNVDIEIDKDSEGAYQALNLNSDNVSVKNKILNIE